MDWTEEVKERLKYRREILFTRDSALLSGLRLALEGQDRRTLVFWALELAGEAVLQLEAAYPGDARPRNAVEAARLWAAGSIKMPAARRAILDCHAMAKELASPADAALCHAIGQACGVVHAPGHGLGFPCYELTAIVRRLGVDNCREAVERRAAEYMEKLICWSGRDTQDRPWANFLRG